MDSEQQPEHNLGLDIERQETWYFTVTFQVSYTLTHEQLLIMGAEDDRLTNEGFRLTLIHDTEPFNQLLCTGNHFGTQQQALISLLEKCRYLFEVANVGSVQLEKAEMNVSEIVEGILEPYFPPPMSTDEFFESDLTEEEFEKMLASPEPPILNVTSHARSLNIFF